MNSGLIMSAKTGDSHDDRILVGSFCWTDNRRTGLTPSDYWSGRSCRLVRRVAAAKKAQIRSSEGVAQKT